MRQTNATNDDLKSLASFFDEVSRWAEHEDYDRVLDRMQRDDTSGDLNTTDLLGTVTPERMRLLSDLLYAVSRVDPSRTPDEQEWDDIADAAVAIASSRDEREVR